MGSPPSACFTVDPLVEAGLVSSLSLIILNSLINSVCQFDLVSEWPRIGRIVYDWISVTIVYNHFFVRIVYDIVRIEYDIFFVFNSLLSRLLFN